MKYVQNYSETNTRKEYTFLLYNPIGLGGVSGQDFANELSFIASLDEVETIHVRICSRGGDVFDGLAIISAMLACKKTIITYNDGLAASIASLIFLAGDITMMWDCALLMFHNCSGNTGSDVLEKFNGILNNLYQKRLNRSADEVRAWMNKETYFSPAEAKELGLVDNVFETEVKLKVPEKITANAENVEALFDLYVTNLATFEGNEALQIKKKFDVMIENKLKEIMNLDTTMTAEAVVEEVQNVLTKASAVAELETVKASLEEKVTNYATEIADVKNKLVEKESEITTLVAEVDNKEKAVIELTNKVNEFEAEEMQRKDEKVNALIENAFVANKIAATEKEDWLAIAKTDYNRAEKLINGLRTVRNKLSDQLTQEAKPVTNILEEKMKAIREKTGQK